MNVLKEGICVSGPVITIFYTTILDFDHSFKRSFCKEARYLRNPFQKKEIRSNIYFLD